MSDIETEREIFDRFYGPKRTVVPAIVVSFDSGGPGRGPTVSVRTVVRTPFIQEDGSSVYYETPVIEGIPVIYPASGVGAGHVGLTWALLPGQAVTLLVADRSHDEYRAGADVSGGIVPADDRRNDLSDAVCLPGDVVPGTDTSAYIPEEGLVVHGDPIKFGAVGASLQLAIGDYVETYLAARWTSYATHVHADPVSGSSGPPSDAADPNGPVAAGDLSSRRLYTVD